jgi:hypothetical protein
VDQIWNIGNLRIGLGGKESTSAEFKWIPDEISGSLGIASVKSKEKQEIRVRRFAEVARIG